MSDPAAAESGLLCAKCRKPLVLGKVKASYLGNSFEVELPHCPDCGFVFVSEALALGKMLQVEQALEDK